MIDLKMHIQDREPDLIIITEVIPKRLSQPVTRICLKLDGYNEFLNFDPEATDLHGHRGLLIYSRKELDVQEVSDFNGFTEQLWVRVTLKNNSFALVGNIYRSPSSGKESIAQVVELLQAVGSTNPPYLVVCGDFNMPGIDWENERIFDGSPGSVQFLEGVQESGLFQHVRDPTRCRVGQVSNVLDLVFTNEENMVTNLEVLPYGLGLSDHRWIDFSLRCGITANRRAHGTLILNWHKAKFEDMRLSLNKLDLASKVLTLPVQEAWDMTEKEIEKLVKEYVPCTTIRKKKQVYMNREALTLRREKERLARIWTLTGQERDKLNFSKCSNKLRKLTRKLKRDKEKDIAMCSKENQKPFWKYVNRNMKNPTGVETLKLEDGSIAETDQEKADVLSSFFRSVFTEEDTNRMPVFPSLHQGVKLNYIEISEQQVAKKLQSLKVGKSPGPDGIPTIFFKECAKELGKPLATIFAKSLEEGVLPQQWKEAVVKPIYKKGSKHQVGNYRPVSLLPIVGKVLEFLVKEAVIDHLLSNRLISDKQHGFVPGRSCETQLLTCFDLWTKMLDKKKPVDVVYIDFKKAFDSVPHQRLLLKLESYGIGPDLLKWFRSFLSGRKQRVNVNGKNSEWVDIASGVPQGSIIGPLCFCLFINDLPDIVLNNMLLFADDAKLFGSASTAEEQNTIQDDLDKIQQWTEQWQLPLNAAKCTVMHLGSQKLRRNYHVGNIELKASEAEKDLGLWVDNKLKFHLQTDKAVRQGHRMIAIIRRTFTYLDEDIFQKLYKALVRPALEYCNVIWGPTCYVGDKHRLENVQ